MKENDLRSQTNYKWYMAEVVKRLKLRPQRARVSNRDEVVHYVEWVDPLARVHFQEIIRIEPHNVKTLKETQSTKKHAHPDERVLWLMKGQGNL